MSGLCSEDDIVTPIYPPHSDHKPRNFESKGYYNHMSALEIQKRIGLDIWHEYTSFCVERNPWDKTISHYFMLKHRSAQELSLQQYFDNGDFCLNYPLYSNQEGVIMVDKILRFETLNQDLRSLFAHLNLPFNGALPFFEKSEYRPTGIEHAAYLSSEQKDKIYEVFRPEITAFSYIP